MATTRPNINNYQHLSTFGQNNFLDPTAIPGRHANMLKSKTPYMATVPKYFFTTPPPKEDSTSQDKLQNVLYVLDIFL